MQNLLDDAILLRGNEAGFAPPKLEQRAFADDYKGRRGQGEIGSPLEVDIDGRPLTAPIVAGPRRVGENDEARRPSEIQDIIEQLGIEQRSLPRSEIVRKAVGSYSKAAKRISVADDLPAAQAGITLAHELGHALDQSVYGGLPLDGIETKARKCYHDLVTGQPNRPQRQWEGPVLHGYPDREVSDRARRDRGRPINPGLSELGL